MRKLSVLALFGLGTSVLAFGSVPEIDPGSGASALTLLAGALLLFRSRRAGGKK